MTIQQEDNKQRGSFFIEENGKRVAELAYTWRSNSVISLDHTEVDESLEGKGVGSALVEYAASFARETGIKFIVYCPFAKIYFARHKNLSDVLAPTQD
ncbi:MAG: N-acetyltransferase [Chitinophagaceae bacterium]|nr:N-acetyltransferase [Chitinophagaceae bacterium]